MKKNLEDLSYSGLVAKIQNDKNIGREILIDIVKEFEAKMQHRKELEKRLKDTETDIANLVSASSSVFKHLELKTPLAIIIPEGIAVISNVSISIERNVL